MSNQSVRLVNSSNIPTDNNTKKGRVNTLNGPTNTTDLPTRLGSSQDANATLASATLASATLNTTASPASKAMMAEISANTAMAVTGLISLQVGTLVLALVIASPFLYRHIKTGRYKKGWFLTRTQAPSLNLLSLNIVTGTVNRAPNVPIGHKSSSIHILFRNIYNKTLLRTVPWFNVPVGKFLFQQMLISLIAIAFMYKNPEPFSNLKRPGWVAATFLPLQFLLAIKNSPLALIGKGHERLNWIHRTLGVLIILFGALNGFIWWRRKVTANAPVIFKGTSYHGLVAQISLLIILLSSIRWVRAKIYQTFLACHILGYSVALVTLWNHVPALKPIVTLSVSFIAVDSLISYLKTSVRSAVFTSLPSRMTMIEVDRIGEGWKAGQYVYLRVFNGLLSYQKHPFTIANAPASISPAGRNTLFLMVKATGDFTNEMHRVGYAEAALMGDLEGNQANIDEKSFHELSGATSDRRLAVAIEGPYGTSYLDMCDQETVFLVAGGSGFTYCTSTLEHIVGNAMKGVGVTKKIVISWALRNIDGESFLYPLERSVGMRATTSPTTCASLDSRGETCGCGVAVGVCGPEALVTSARLAVSSADQSLTKKGAVKLLNFPTRKKSQNASWKIQGLHYEVCRKSGMFCKKRGQRKIELRN